MKTIAKGIFKASLLSVEWGGNVHLTLQVAASTGMTWKAMLTSVCEASQITRLHFAFIFFIQFLPDTIALVVYTCEDNCNL